MSYVVDLQFIVRGYGPTPYFFGNNPNLFNTLSLLDWIGGIFFPFSNVFIKASTAVQSRYYQGSSSELGGIIRARPVCGS